VDGHLTPDLFGRLDSAALGLCPDGFEPSAFFEEVNMFRIQAPVVIVPTVEARKVLGRRLHWAGLAAYREITVAAKGLEIAHLQFTFFKLTLAVCSRIRRDGIVEIEIGLGDPNLPVRTFTAAQIRQAMATARARAEGERHNRPTRAR
jgi:hypothetical protein